MSRLQKFPRNGASEIESNILSGGRHEYSWRVRSQFAEESYAPISSRMMRGLAKFNIREQLRAFWRQNDTPARGLRTHAGAQRRRI
jgi:hypothetical protein